MKKYIYKTFIKLVNLVLFFLPSSFLRVGFLRMCGANISADVYIENSVRVDFPWRLKIGANCYISRHVYLDCRGGKISIGNNTDISEGVKVYTLSHSINSIDFSIIKNDVKIGSRVWICTMAIVLPGSILSDGCVLGANSIFTGNSSVNSLYIGNHATLIKSLPNDRSSNVRC